MRDLLNKAKAKAKKEKKKKKKKKKQKYCGSKSETQKFTMICQVGRGGVGRCSTVYPSRSHEQCVTKPTVPILKLEQCLT